MKSKLIISSMLMVITICTIAQKKSNYETERFKIQGNYEYAVVKFKENYSAGGGEVQYRNQWITKRLNSLQVVYTESPEWVKINSDVLTLESGTYLVKVYSLAHYVQHTKLRLFNIDQNRTEISGLSSYAWDGGDQTGVYMSGIVNVREDGKKFQVQQIYNHAYNHPNAQGISVEGVFSQHQNDDIYTIVEIMRFNKAG